jgi:hypothetical protein
MSTIGRPTSYHPEFCELACNYCLLGATNEELAGFFDVAPRTIDNWIARIPEFAAAVLEGRAVADSRVAAALYQRAVGYDSKDQRTVLWRGEERTLTKTVHHPPDIRACIFWLRNRRRQDWSDRPQLPSTDPPNGQNWWETLDATEKAGGEHALPEPPTAEQSQAVVEQDVEPVNERHRRAETHAPGEAHGDVAQLHLSTGAQGPHCVVTPEQIEQGPERPATLRLQVGIALDHKAGVVAGGLQQFAMGREVGKAHVGQAALPGA